MNWQPITFEELKGLGRRVDTEYVIADDLPDFYRKMSNYDPKEWALLRAPAWCGDKLVGLVLRPRTE